MKIFDYSITFVELPTEINLTFFVHGCPYKCKGCSWENEVRDVYDMNLKDFKEVLESYRNKCSAVVFLGGEWDSELSEFLLLSKGVGYKTCLYTGLSLEKFERVGYRDKLFPLLDYIKVGEWKEELGGLTSKETNQVMYVLNGGTIADEIKFNK